MLQFVLPFLPLNLVGIFQVARKKLEGGGGGQFEKWNAHCTIFSNRDGISFLETYPKVEETISWVSGPPITLKKLGPRSLQNGEIGRMANFDTIMWLFIRFCKRK
jgi:hypothetical protein